MPDDTRDRPRTVRREEPARGAGIAAWAVSLLLVAFILGMLLSPWFERQVRPRLPFAAVQGTDLGAVNARLDQQERAISLLEGRLARVETRPSGGTVTSTGDTVDDEAPRALNDPDRLGLARSESMGGIEARVDALDRQQTTLGSRVDNLSAEVAGLTVRVEDSRGEVANRAQQAQEIAKSARAVLLIGQARAAFEGGRPLGETEAALRNLLGPDADPDVNQLSDGLRTLAGPDDLEQRFDELEPRLLEAAPAAEPQSAWDRFVASLADLFQVRRKDELDESRANEAILDRIARELGRRDIAAAVADYQRLPEVVQRRGARWERDAVRYVQTERALDRLEASVARGEVGTTASAPAGDAVPL